MQAEIDEKNRQQQMQSSHKGVTTPVNTSPQLNSRLNNANSMFLCEEVNSTIKRLKDRIVTVCLSVSMTTVKVCVFIS